MTFHSLSSVALASSLYFACVSGASAEVWEVNDDRSLRATLKAVTPGTTVRIAPGQYEPKQWLLDKHGTAEKPIVIEGADPDDPPRFEGDRYGWHIRVCSHVHLRNIICSGQSENAITIDDGYNPETPTHHLVLEGIHIFDVNPDGNNDGFHTGGLDDFVIRGCTFKGWGGSAIDLVGSHRGLIEDCKVVGKDGKGKSGIQIKGGSDQITIRGCRFTDAGEHSVNLGGRTGLKYFRPQGASYEARDLVVEGCTFVGGEAPIAFFNSERVTVRYNTIINPEAWVLRILQTNPAELGFVPCREGQFHRNLIVYQRVKVNSVANIGPDTRPDTFSFRENFWYSEDRPFASVPRLPTREEGAVYGKDPELTMLDDGTALPENPDAKSFGAGGLETSSEDQGQSK